MFFNFFTKAMIIAQEKVNFSQCFRKVICCVYSNLNFSAKWSENIVSKSSVDFVFRSEKMIKIVLLSKNTHTQSPCWPAVLLSLSRASYEYKGRQRSKSKGFPTDYDESLPPPPLPPICFHPASIFARFCPTIRRETSVGVCVDTMQPEMLSCLFSTFDEGRLFFGFAVHFRFFLYTCACVCVCQSFLKLLFSV